MQSQRIISGALVLCSLVSVATADEIRVFAPLSITEAREQTQAWIAAHYPADEELAEVVAQLWSVDGEAEWSPAKRFELVMRSFYVADPGVRELVDACAFGGRVTHASDFPVLAVPDGDPFFMNNVRYFYARYLTVLTLYDEALSLFEIIDPAQVVDPAGCLFYQAVCQHSLLMQEEGLATISRLLDNTEDVPLRYRTVAELMQHDLSNLREKTLDEVARQMGDVRRRLALGRAGLKVQRVEERIITTLDEIIEKLEQQQGGGGGGGGQAQGNQSGSPADESYVGGQKGPGETDERDIGHKDNWGDLPEKAQAAAKNLINRQFPAHYRQAVEEYLRKIAERQAPTGD
ncbi:MAG: hypothetical protein ACF8TS_11300 [Maioricimonas sp. JB049]